MSCRAVPCRVVDAVDLMGQLIVLFVILLLLLCYTDRRPEIVHRPTMATVSAVPPNRAVLFSS